MSTGSLSQRYYSGNEVFVTAFYGVYDPATLTLTYACAGHNPPRLRRCGDGSSHSLDEVGGPPLGLFDELDYDQTTLALRPGDILAFYTDGITEAMDADSVQFGVTRLDAVLAALRARRARDHRRHDRGRRSIHRRPSPGGRPHLAGRRS